MSFSAELIFLKFNSFLQNEFKFPNLKTYSMERRTLKNVNKFLNANIYSFLEASGGQFS